MGDFGEALGPTVARSAFACDTEKFPQRGDVEADPAGEETRDRPDDAVACDAPSVGITWFAILYSPYDCSSRIKIEISIKKIYSSRLLIRPELAERAAVRIILWL